LFLLIFDKFDHPSGQLQHFLQSFIATPTPGQSLVFQHKTLHCAKLSDPIPAQKSTHHDLFLNWSFSDSASLVPGQALCSGAGVAERSQETPIGLFWTYFRLF
jgi:hypothetical protein